MLLLFVQSIIFVFGCSLSPHFNTSMKHNNTPLLYQKTIFVRLYDFVFHHYSKIKKIKQQRNSKYQKYSKWTLGEAVRKIERTENMIFCCCLKHGVLFFRGGQFDRLLLVRNRIMMQEGLSLAPQGTRWSERTNYNLIATKAKTIGLIVEHPTAQTCNHSFARFEKPRPWTWVL